MTRKSVNDCKTLDAYLDEQMQDPEFRKEYEDIQPELDIIRKMMEGYTSFDCNEE